MSTDPFASMSPGLNAPATHGENVNPSTLPLDTIPRFVIVSGDGFLSGTVISRNGGERSITIRALAGIPYPIRFRKILPETTATGITVFW